MKSLIDSKAASLLFLLVAASGCEPGPTPRAEAPDAEAVGDPATAPVRDPVLEAALENAVAEIEGAVGVAVLHLQRNVRAAVNGDRRFALASVSKLPIAYAAMQGGHTGPADTVSVAPADVTPGDSPFGAGRAVTMKQLVERSLGHSDNTASDVLLRVAGGTEEVNRRLHAIGAGEVRVDRSMRQIFVDWRAARTAFVDDVRDSGSAEGIVTLLAALHRGEGLRSEARQLLLEALQAAVTGPHRIRAGVPAGTTVAHKTGTLGPLTHDVGIVTLPAGRGEVALAVLVLSDAQLDARERVIAAAARAVWSRFAEDGEG